MSTLNDTDLFLVQRNGTSYKETFLNVKNGLNPTAGHPIIGVTSVTYSDVTGNRFTGESVNLNVTMQDAGTPTGVISIKPIFQGIFNVDWNSDKITNVNYTNDTTCVVTIASTVNFPTLNVGDEVYTRAVKSTIETSTITNVATTTGNVVEAYLYTDPGSISITPLSPSDVISFLTVTDGNTGGTGGNSRSPYPRGGPGGGGGSSGEVFFRSMTRAQYEAEFSRTTHPYNNTNTFGGSPGIIGQGPGGGGGPHQSGGGSGNVIPSPSFNEFTLEKFFPGLTFSSGTGGSGGPAQNCGECAGGGGGGGAGVEIALNPSRIETNPGTISIPSPVSGTPGPPQPGPSGGRAANPGGGGTGFGAGGGGGAGGHEGPGYWNGRPGGAGATGIDVIFFGQKSKTITMTNNDNFDFFHAGQIIQAPAIQVTSVSAPTNKMIVTYSADYLGSDSSGTAGADTTITRNAINGSGKVTAIDTVNKTITIGSNNGNFFSSTEVGSDVYLYSSKQITVNKLYGYIGAGTTIITDINTVDIGFTSITSATNVAIGITDQFQMRLSKAPDEVFDARTELAFEVNSSNNIGTSFATTDSVKSS